jgi:hypothetical protein
MKTIDGGAVSGFFFFFLLNHSMNEKDKKNAYKQNRHGSDHLLPFPAGPDFPRCIFSGFVEKHEGVNDPR